jgi:hypothetical protein
MKRISNNSKKARVSETVSILLPSIFKYSDPGGALSKS